MEFAMELEKDEKIISGVLSEINNIFGWQDKDILHAVMHMKNAVYNLKADLAVEKALKEAAEDKLRMISKYYTENK